MWLTLHDERRAWKSFDWAATDRLYQNGFICDPANKIKSVRGCRRLKAGIRLQYRSVSGVTVRRYVRDQGAR
ncbi:DUF6429 family protein [Microvirga arsenatis]|uniref:DUF6429 family protein n=1 Tax=Microvirga arsenatis TaxID=2692265 RepID=UPI001FE94ED8|nr:DUF6429 family protein [Microvirga arsenatis]